MLKNFNENYLVLWKTEAPQCVLRRIGNCQIAESLSIWYEYRSAMLKDMNLYQYHLQDYLWSNKNVSVKHRPFFHYPVWQQKGIHTISQLYYGFNRVKTFEELVLEFDIHIKDRNKYDSLLNAVYLDWFLDPKEVTEELFDSILSRLVKTCKVPKHAYNVLRNKEFVSCDKIESKWE